MGGLGGRRDPGLGLVAAPCRHQRMQRVPVGDAVLLGREPWLRSPVRRTHRLQPRLPLAVLTRGDRGIAVAGWQDAHRGAIAIADALAGPASARLARPRQFGDRQRRQRLVHRYIDDGAIARQRRMHAGARRRDTAQERRLLAGRGHRRFGQVVDLPGQHPGDAAGEAQRQVAGGLLGPWAGLPERRNQHDRGRWIAAA